MTTIIKIRLMIINLLLLLVVGCSVFHHDPEAAYQGLDAEQLYQRAEIELDGHNYSEAASMLETLDARYPFNKNAQQAQLNIIYAYYKAGDKASAAAAADRYIRLYPRGAHTDYAYYMQGVANFEQDHGLLQRYLPVDQADRDPGTARQAYDNFVTLSQRFPDSQYTADAQQRLIYLRNLFARNELHVAKFYLRREAYVAAANRASQIIERYPQAPAVPEALVVLVKAKYALGLQGAGDNALRVLKQNYPQAPETLALERDLHHVQAGRTPPKRWWQILS
ncbi:MAG: hypothetical protein Tsb005_06350 [Gammaproteobacteria bacterium]